MKKKILLTLAFLFTLLLGIGIGGAANTPAPVAPRVETIHVPGPTVTETVTPQECKLAMAAAADLININIEGFRLMREAYAALGDQDLSRMEANTEEMNDLTPKVAVARDRYDNASADCEAVQ